MYFSVSHGPCLEEYKSSQRSTLTVGKLLTSCRDQTTCVSQSFWLQTMIPICLDASCDIKGNTYKYWSLSLIPDSKRRVVKFIETSRMVVARGVEDERIGVNV